MSTKSKVAAKPTAAPRAADPRDATTPPEQSQEEEVAPRPRKRRADEDLVSVSVPRAFRLTLDTGAVVEIQPGIQDLPREQAEHPYSAANGVEIND